ncbi:hypothetical protein MNBD_GAMMA16-1875 [hydrothermal vent metagenome]|uniref:Uncharacterized protein n=1 Tax=hydrothermal vent metagenome TaxID=652676 RepID=A0A3B0Z4S3_9ZZZZ
MRTKTIYCFILKIFLILTLLPGFTWAFSSVSRDFNELVTLADTIIIGTVVKQQSHWDDPVAQDFIHTAITLDNIEMLKGDIETSTYTLIIVGGAIPPFVISIPGAPSFVTNKRYVLFIKDNNKVIFPLVGVHDGVFIIEASKNGKSIVKNNEGVVITEIRQNKVVTQTETNKSLITAQSLSLDGFKQEIMHHLGHSGEKNE